jgi:hypothetical protein
MQQELQQMGVRVVGLLLLVLVVVGVGVHGLAAGGQTRETAAIFLQAGWWQIPRLRQISRAMHRNLGWTLGS